MTIGPFLAAGLPMGECWPEWRGGEVVPVVVEFEVAVPHLRPAGW